MKFWWLLDSVRFGLEKASLEALTRESWFSLQRWTLVDGRLAIEAVLSVHGHAYPVRLVYPDQFPQVPAWVEPQDLAAKWSAHQYGTGGVLCLELRPDNWQIEATGGDVLRSAYNLLAAENPLGAEGTQGSVPSAHDVGAVQAYDHVMNPIFVGAKCHERILCGTAEELKAFKGGYRDRVFPFFVHDRMDRTSDRRPPGEVSDFIPVLVSARPLPGATNTRESVAAELACVGVDASALSEADHALVLVQDDGVLHAFQILSDMAIRRGVMVVPDTAGNRSGRTGATAAKRVAIVGVGSVGSKVAESLVRSGICDLFVFDGDILLPGNLERHALDWQDVGHRKVHGIKRRLHLIAPGARVVAIDESLNWQRSAKLHALETDLLARCDLIVDATGDSATGLFLGAIAVANKRSFVSIEVFEGGIGALVASSVPGRDAPFAVARTAFLQWCDEQNCVAPRSTGRPYEASTDDGTPIIADDAAVTIAAAHASRVILDILDGRPAPRASSWLLVGMAESWLFNGHGHNIRFDPGAAAPETEARVDEEAQAFALSLLKETIGETAASQ